MAEINVSVCVTDQMTPPLVEYGTGVDGSLIVVLVSITVWFCAVPSFNHTNFIGDGIPVALHVTLRVSVSLRVNNEPSTGATINGFTVIKYSTAITAIELLLLN